MCGWGSDSCCAASCEVCSGPQRVWCAAGVVACGGRAPERGGGVTLCGAVGGECDAATLCGECATVLACTGVAGAGDVADA